MTMAVMMQPISRVIAIATRLATKIEAPNCWSWTAPTNARMSPIRKLIRLTMPSARGPQSCTTRRRSEIRNRARRRIRAPKAIRLSPRNPSPTVTARAVAIALVPRRASHGGCAPVRPVCCSGTASAIAISRRTPSGSPARSAAMPRACISPSTLSTNVTSPESHAATCRASNARWLTLAACSSLSAPDGSGRPRWLNQWPASSSTASSGSGCLTASVASGTETDAAFMSSSPRRQVSPLVPERSQKKECRDTRSRALEHRATGRANTRAHRRPEWRSSPQEWRLRGPCGRSPTERRLQPAWEQPERAVRPGSTVRAQHPRWSSTLSHQDRESRARSPPCLARRAARALTARGQPIDGEHELAIQLERSRTCRVPSGSVDLRGDRLLEGGQRAADLAHGRHPALPDAIGKNLEDHRHIVIDANRRCPHGGRTPGDWRRVSGNRQQDDEHGLGIRSQPFDLLCIRCFHAGLELGRLDEPLHVRHLLRDQLTTRIHVPPIVQRS